MEAAWCALGPPGAQGPKVLHRPLGTRPPLRCRLSRAQEITEGGVQAHPGSLSQVSPVSGPFPGVSSPEGPGSLANWTCLSPGKLALDEGGSDTESLYEIAGLNKVIQFM